MGISDFNFPSRTGSNNMYCVSDKSNQGHVGVLLDYDNGQGYGQSYMMFYLNYIPQNNNTVQVSVKQVEGTNSSRPHSQWESTVSLSLNGQSILSGTVKSYDLYNGTSETLKSANSSNILYGGTRKTITLTGIDTTKDISSQIQVSGSIRFSYIIETVIPTYEKDYRDGWGVDSRSYSGTTTYTHSHSWGDWITTIPSTCSATGTQVRQCTNNCGATQTSSVPINPDAHKYGNKIVIQPTCTTKGYDKYICEYNSSHIYMENYTDMIGHSYGTVIVQPTCTKQGYTDHICKNCGHIYTDTYVEPLGHSWGEWEVTVEPQYQKEGEASRFCPVCQTTEKKILAALQEALRRALIKIQNNNFIANIAMKDEEGKIIWFKFLPRIGN